MAVDTDLYLWPLFPEARGDMLIHPFYPITATPHYISLDMMRDFVGQGTQGPTGPPGSTGPAGPAGPSGPQGPSGEIGTQGPVGPVGPQGAMGAAGPAGSVGPAGATGPAGPPGSLVTISDTAPASPSPTDMWWDSVGGQLYLRYNDGNSSQWVPATNMPGPQGPAGQTWTVGSGLTLSANTLSLTTPALPLAGGTLTGSLTVDSAAQVTLAASAGDYTVLKAPTTGGNITLGGTSAVYNYYINTNHQFRNLSALDTMLLDGAGNLLIAGSNAYKTGGGSWIAPSDPILKRDVAEYKSGLAEVLALKPIEYKYNGKGGLPDDGQSYVGLDARATEPVMPELVGSMMVVLDPSRRQEGRSEPDTEIKTIDASPLVYALVNAVKELSAKVAALEAKP